MSREEAMAALSSGAGSQFDPHFVQVFLSLLESKASPALPASLDRSRGDSP
jgi:HD-GYP domain-containing protein (c-di-GMP phosphodiesterase class II)